MHDFGAAQATAKDMRKNILIFFVAQGNRDVARYERDYFTDPGVRAAMDNFVLVMLDFPTSTKLAYTFGIFGAGWLAVSDALGGPVGKVTQLPKDPAELARQLNQYK